MAETTETTVQPTTPAPADGDAARYETMRKEFGDAPTDAKPAEKPAETAPEPEKTAETKPAPLPYEELEKRHRNLQAALGESRLEQKQLRERQQAAEAEAKRMGEFLRALAQGQQSRSAEADPYLDPVRQKVESLAEQAARLERETSSQREVLEQQRQQAALAQYVTQAEAEFARQAPDYSDAVRYLSQHREQEYAAMYPDGHPRIEDMAIQNGFRTSVEFRRALVQRDAMLIATHAAQTGQNPAELAYSIAKQRGYAQRQAAPVIPLRQEPAPAPASRIETIRRGQQAAGSLSTGGGGTPADGAWPSVAELANMYLTDPDKADTIIGKMRAAGALN